MKAQEQLAFEVTTLLDSTKRVAARIKKQRKEIFDAVTAGKATDQQLAQDKELEKVEAVLNTKEGIYETPMLIDQINYLRQQLDQADQRPGKDLYLRYEELLKQAQVVFGKR